MAKIRSTVDSQTQKELNDENLNSEQEFLNFVQEQIELIKKYTKVYNDSGIITFDQLNSVLTKWADINATLLGIYTIAKLEYRKAQEKFETWFAEKYVLVRSIENPKNLSAQKWASQKEIELIVRTQFKEEFEKQKLDLLILERRVSFLRRTIELWTNQQYILSTLSKNLQAELAGLNLSADKILGSG